MHLCPPHQSVTTGKTRHSHGSSPAPKTNNTLSLDTSTDIKKWGEREVKFGRIAKLSTKRTVIGKEFQIFTFAQMLMMQKWWLNALNPIFGQKFTHDLRTGGLWMRKPQHAPYQCLTFPRFDTDCHRKTVTDVWQFPIGGNYALHLLSYFEYPFFVLTR